MVHRGGKSGITRNSLLLLSLIGFLAGCSHKLAPLAHYQQTPVVADGIPDDWTLPLRFANADYTVQYNVTNDDSNLYVCVLSRDEPTIIRMLRAGITLYFDPRGQNARGVSLHYPLRKQPDPAVRDRNTAPVTAGNDSGWEQELIRQSDAYGTTGFSGIDNGQFAVTDGRGPARIGLRLNHHDSLLVYEAIVPISGVLGAGYRNRSPKKAISVGVVLNTPSGQRAVNEPQRHHGGRGLGLGMNGMHMGGGRRSYEDNADRTPVKEDASWYPFRIAVR